MRMVTILPAPEWVAESPGSRRSGEQVTARLGTVVNSSFDGIPDRREPLPLVDEHGASPFEREVRVGGDHGKFGRNMEPANGSLRFY